MDLTVVVGHGATTGTDFDKAPECGWGEVIFDIHRANARSSTTSSRGSAHLRLK